MSCSAARVYIRSCTGAVQSHRQLELGSHRLKKTKPGSMLVLSTHVWGQPVHLHARVSRICPAIPCPAPCSLRGRRGALVIRAARPNPTQEIPILKRASGPMSPLRQSQREAANNIAPLTGRRFNLPCTPFMCMAGYPWPRFTSRVTY